jgi:hypothetical protein
MGNCGELPMRVCVGTVIVTAPRKRRCSGPCRRLLPTGDVASGPCRATPEEERTLTRTQMTEAGAHIAVLRGLYGDIAENLHDPDLCNELWAQVEEQQQQLAELVPAVVAR